MILVTKQKSGRLTKAILETADGMHRAGIMDDAAHAKITLRHPGRPIRDSGTDQRRRRCARPGKEKTDYG
jgi:hypothetical protein